MLAFALSFFKGIHKVGVIWFARKHVLSVDTHLKGVFIFSFMQTQVVDLSNNTIIAL